MIYDITSDLVFEIGAILDACAVIDTEDRPVLPYLTFSKSEQERETLIASANGSCFHEMAFGIVNKVFESPDEAIASDYLVAELDIQFTKGRPLQTNILKSDLENAELLQLNLEMALGIREIEEIHAKIDTTSRFTKLMKKKQGITSFVFKPILAGNSEYTIELKDSKYGDVEETVEDIAKLIKKVAKQWE